MLQDKLRNRLIGAQMYPCSQNQYCLTLWITLELKIFECSTPATVEQRAMDCELSFLTTLRVLPSMSLRTLRLKIVKCMKLPTQSLGHVSIKLWLKMGDGTLAQLDSSTDQDLAWWGLENGSDLFFYMGRE